MSDNAASFSGLQSSDGDLGKQMLEILKTMQKDNRDMKQMMGQKFAAMEQKYAAMEQKYAVMEQNDAARKQENEALRKDVDKLIPRKKDYVIAGALGGVVGSAAGTLIGYIGGYSISTILALGASGGIVGLVISVSAVAIFAYKKKICETLSNFWLRIQDKFRDVATKDLYYRLDKFCQEKTGMKLE